jgi:metal-responsive CopG/Arc/MetJ family transcriptional regulator
MEWFCKKERNMADSINTDKITLDLPSNLIAQIDAQIGSEFADRADFMRAATRHYLEHMQNRSIIEMQNE